MRQQATDASVPRRLSYTAKSLLQWVPLLLVILPVCCVAVFYAIEIWHVREYMKEADAFQERFSGITMGMAEQQVRLAAGEPDSIVTSDPIVQYHGRPSDYRKPIPNPNKAFYYEGPIDYLACIVFDAEDRVAYINVGGT